MSSERVDYKSGFNRRRIAIELLEQGNYAEISLGGQYRYWLSRRWADGPLVVWVMLNPSTADALQDDATIRRCIGWAKRWDAGGILVLNLYAYRTTRPAELHAYPWPVGDLNDRMLSELPILVGRPERVICAWGDLPKRCLPRAQQVWDLLEPLGPQCLGRTASGNPRHPVRLAYATPLEPFHRPTLES